MKFIIVSITVAAGLAFAGSSISAEMPAVAKKNVCAACHSIDKKLVGPAWQAVADKYKGDAGAADMLMAKIAKGGKDVWGKIAMPPQPKLNEADNKEIVEFILGLAK